MTIRTKATRVTAAIAVAVLLSACGASHPSRGASGHHTKRQRAATGSATTSTSTSSTTSASTSTSTTTTTTTTGSTNAVPAGFVAESFTAVSTTHWWLLGRVSCGTSSCPSLITTTDGGQHFQTLPVPGGAYSSSVPTTPPVAGVRFANPQDGWAFGAKLYATHDGGRQWTQVVLPGTVTDLEAGLDQVFAVVVPPCSNTGGCTSSQETQLWRTSPDSNDWQPDHAAGAVGAGSLAVHGRSVWVMNSVSTKDGWALGTGLLTSTDDGDHFTLQSQQVPGVSCTYEPVSTSVVWAYCSGGHFMFAYMSTDGGTHFAAVGTQTSSTTSPVGCNNGSGLAAASPTVAVAACNYPAGSPLLRTDDSGRTWTAVQKGLDSNGNWNPIGFTTDQVGYAFWREFGSNTQLWRTTNGGASWYRVTALS